LHFPSSNGRAPSSGHENRSDSHSRMRLSLSMQIKTTKNLEKTQAS
jgi:hypothetical protein